MKNPFYIFRIKRGERWQALGALLYILLWNVLVIAKYADKLTAITDNYARLFTRTFHISGFDPMSYIVVSSWGAGYNIYRHPLLAFFMYVPYLVNQAFMALTGSNGALFIVALIIMFCAFYSFIFLFRIFREVLGLDSLDATLLGALTFSFAYVMVTISVPDHFCLSMFMLILTLYVAGKKLAARHPFTIWQTFVFFLVTGGISLNNAIKVFLANLFCNGRRFFTPKNLLLAVILPSILMWIGARQEWILLEKPHYLARKEAKARKDSTLRADMLRAFRDTTSLKDSAEIMKAYRAALQKKIRAKYVADHKKAWNAHKGTPINKSEFGSWTDISTPRWPSMVENIFGEPIQLHQDHLLGDVLISRPVIVNYRYAVNYVVEALVALFFLAGVWCGRRSRFLWLALSFFGFDLLIHFVLGFGLNEAYIMSAHWLFILTLSMGYLVLRARPSRLIVPLRITLLALTLWLVAWNGALYMQHLL